jgi:hypothetical protein
MFNYLKNCIREAVKKALGEKDVKIRTKTIFWDEEIKKKAK